MTRKPKTGERERLERLEREALEACLMLGVNDPELPARRAELLKAIAALAAHEAGE
jgi:hypothetical protein